MAGRRKYDFKGAAQILANTSTSGEVSAPDELSAKTTAKTDDNPILDMQEKIQQIDSSTQHEKAFNFKFVPREKIIFNEDNKFPIKAIEKLAESILTYGLMHNLEVLYEEDSDTYKIESGERRTRALDYLIDKFKDSSDYNSEDYKLYQANVMQFASEGYPCNVKKTNVSMETLSEEDAQLENLNSRIRLRVANLEVRDFSEDSSIIRKEILELNHLYEERNKLLQKGEKININKTLGEKFGITDRQVKNYKATAKLIPELQDLFDQNNITLTDGVNYSKLTEEEQQQLLNLINDGKSREEVNALYKDIDRMKKEIEKKESELKKLQDEKEATQSEMEQAKANAKELESKIRHELEESISESSEVKKLEKQLEDAKEKINQSENKWKNTISKQDDVIAELQKKLDEKKAATTTDTETLLLTYKVEDAIKGLEKVLEQLTADLSSYSKVYDDKKQGKKPAEYETEINAIIKKFKR